MKNRTYHLIVVNVKSKAKTYMTKTPVTHSEACVMKSKLTPHPARMIQLEEA